MTEPMRVLPFDTLLRWMTEEYAAEQSMFAIPDSLFYRPQPDDPFALSLHGQHLATPIGPAAGPHTQLAQNIVAAWLTGGRFIELKTVQILDKLEIPRPCIDMAEEGYNVEWSQELRLDVSAMEYAKAWVLVHLLPHLLRFPEPDKVGTLFNMSVGYNLEGILSPAMQRFMDRMENASEDLLSLQATLRRRLSDLTDVVIPDRIVHCVTLSTMHGCPPHEIDEIARHLIEDRGLHTTVKLNPTLLGRTAVLETLHDRLGYTRLRLPDAVFDHDLSYDRALHLIDSLQASADRRGVTFTVKLSNTLPMANHRGVLPGSEMYMSGRALFPLTVQLFRRLRSDLGPSLAISYSAGADAENLPLLLAAGAVPVTLASDLLRPGGYGRLSHALVALKRRLHAEGTSSLEAWMQQPDEALEALVIHALSASRYTRAHRSAALPKVDASLPRFDCIVAPCVAQCAVCQDIPEYAHWIRHGAFDRALSTILHRNPLPATTGAVCTHLCETRCTRSNYDQPVSIRRLKRFAVENTESPLQPSPHSGHRVAIVGSGPAGLSAAFYLALSGFAVTVFEAEDRPGGMLSLAPRFRLPSEAVASDIARIRDLGVEILCDRRVTEAPEALLEDGFSGVIVACGFGRDATLALDGGPASGVIGALRFLRDVAQGKPPTLGEHVVVIGGGNTAMDAARTAQRLTGSPSTVLYRRTRAEMPAETEEIDDLLLEGNRLEELVLPQRLCVEDGVLTGLACLRATLGPPDPDGRRRPIPVDGTAFVVPATHVIEAVGQRPDTGFLAASRVVVRASDHCIEVADGARTTVPRVYAGGDISRGPAIIIAACADGATAAKDLCSALDVPFHTPRCYSVSEESVDTAALKVARTQLSVAQSPTLLRPEARQGFDRVEGTLTADQAIAEASRCLQCQLLCDKCVDVCPNRANVPLRITPLDVVLPRLEHVDGQLVPVAMERIEIRQSRQILHLDELCNQCGNCSTFCVHQGDPYRDKPRLFLDRDTFDAQEENAFWRDADGISCKVAGALARWRRLPDGRSEYLIRGARFVLDRAFSLEESDISRCDASSVSFRPAVEMAVLADALRRASAYLPLSGALGGRDV